MFEKAGVHLRKLVTFAKRAGYQHYIYLHIELNSCDIMTFHILVKITSAVYENNAHQQQVVYIDTWWQLKNSPQEIFCNLARQWIDFRWYRSKALQCCTHSIWLLRSIERYHDFHTPDKQHDDVIKWKHFPRYWPFVRGIHRSPVNSPYKGQWRGALMFFLFALE